MKSRISFGSGDSGTAERTDRLADGEGGRTSIEPARIGGLYPGSSPDNGAVVDARVDNSSGYTRLDAAALDGVRRGYHFIAATENGRPIEMWQRIAVTSRLSDHD